MLDTGNNGFVINESGRYDLKFNSVIDSEQLPLYNIIVSWGDSENSVDVITDQDHRPDEDFPHVISHNYIGIEGEQSVYIKIKIDDNWGYNRCCMGDRNCGYYPPDANECPAICPVCD